MLKVLALMLTVQAAMLAQPPMTNADIIRMSQQGIAPEAITEAIRTAKSTAFQVTPEDQPALLDAGVPRPVVMAMVRRSMRDEANRGRMQPIRPAAIEDVPTPVARPVDRPAGWSLGTGKPELSLRAGGGSYFNSGGGVTRLVSAGAGVGVGVSRHIAILGEYGYSDFRGFVLLPLAVGSVKIHDVIAGVRAGLSGRVAPYIFAGGGMARRSGVAMTLNGFGAQSSADPAIAFGGGLNFSLRRSVGIQWDVRAVKPSDFVWYARSSGGLYVRF